MEARAGPPERRPLQLRAVQRGPRGGAPCPRGEGRVRAGRAGEERLRGAQRSASTQRSARYPESDRPRRGRRPARRRQPGLRRPAGQVRRAARQRHRHPRGHDHRAGHRHGPARVCGRSPRSSISTTSSTHCRSFPTTWPRLRCRTKAARRRRSSSAPAATGWRAIWHSGSPMAGIINLVRGMHVCVPRNMTQAAGFYNTLLQRRRSGDRGRGAERLPPEGEAAGEHRRLHRPPRRPGGAARGEGRDRRHLRRLLPRSPSKPRELLRARCGIEAEVIDVQTLLPFDRARPASSSR